MNLAWDTVHTYLPHLRPVPCRYPGVMWGLGQHMSETINPFPIRTQPDWLWFPVPMPRLLADLTRNLAHIQTLFSSVHNSPSSNLECQFVRNASSVPAVSRRGPAEVAGPTLRPPAVPFHHVQSSKLFRDAPESSDWKPYPRNFPRVHRQAGPGSACFLRLTLSSC